jgi:hypothetical protein
MKQHIAQEWVADLRTNPPQAKEVLYNGHGYCCLGRLCVVLGEQFFLTDESEDSDSHYQVMGDDEYVLPNALVQLAGMHANDGEPIDGRGIVVGSTTYKNLAEANDAGETMRDIAEAIDRDWERL